jgi:hypothetical protein
MSTFGVPTRQAGGAFVLDDPWGYQNAESTRQSLIVLGYLGGVMDLGGSDDVGVSSGSPPAWQPVRAVRHYELEGDELGGLTLQVVAYSRIAPGSPVGSPAPTVQWRLRNVTDSANAALGTAHSSETATEEVKTVTLAAGTKTYRLEVFGDIGALFAWGYLRFRKVPA